MSIFSRLTSHLRSEHRRGRRGYVKRRTRFAPFCDALDVRALLSSLVVTNTNDAGAGSLRQAILDAPSGATISFANSLKAQTITPTSGELAINQNLNIDGLGASEQAVSGGGSSSVFDVAGGANVTISGLTITGGVADDGFGGGIVNAGNLTLKDSQATGNQAVAAFLACLYPEQTPLVARFPVIKIRSASPAARSRTTR